MQEPTASTYVLNTNTKKFHYLSCSGAESINDSNRAEHTVIRNEVDAMCYEPCKRSNL